MWHNDPDFLPRHLFRWGASSMVAIAVVAMLLADISVDYRVTAAAVPVLSASVADGATDVAVNAALTVDSTVALSATEVSGGWFTRTSGITNGILSISCVSATTCFTVDDANRIRKTTNAGRTWTTVYTHSPTALYNVGETLKDVFFVNATTGFAVGSQETCVLDFCSADRPTFLRSTDSGASWVEYAAIQMDSNLGNSTSDWGLAVSFVNASQGVIVTKASTGERYIYSTSDGGPSWQRNQMSISQDMVDVSCPSASLCVLVGNGGTILTTTDWGLSLTARTSGTANNLRATHCWSSTGCLAVGASGTILLTTNGGAAWTSQTSGTSNQLNGVYCTGAAPECWAVGNSGTVLYTADGDASPATWTAQTSGTTNALNAVHGSSGSRALAVGASGTTRQYTGVLLQANTGNTQAGAPTGTNLCTSVTLGADGSGNANRRITCAHADFTTNTWYTLTVTTSITDTVGDALASTFTRTFQNASGAPTLSAASVADGATAQALDVALTLDFNTPLAAGTVTTSNVTLQANTGNTQAGAPTGTNLCTSVTLGADGSGNANRRITCGHANLSAGTWYTLTATTGITSSTGIALAANVTRALQTGPVPTLSAASVADGATGQAVNVALTLDFSATLSAATVTTSTITLQANTGNTQGGAPSGANLCTSVTLGADGSGNADRRITCTHANLAGSTWHTLTATTGVTSSAIVPLAANVTRAFQTAPGPALSAASVADGAINQAVNVALTLDFDAALAAGTVTTSNVTLQANTGNTQAGAPTGTNLCTSVTLGNDNGGNANRRITCTHANFTPGTWFTLTATTGVTSSTNVPLAANVTRAFATVVSLSSASVTNGATSQAGNVTLTLDFDAALASATVTTSTVILQANTGNTQDGAPSGANLCSSVSLGNDNGGNANRRITCAHGSLSNTTWFTLTATTGVTSSANTALSASVTRAFQTTTTPALSASTVSDGEVGVSPTATLAISSSKALLASTVISSGSWPILFSDSPALMTDAWFVSASVGWTVGAIGYIQKTTDGGVTWTQQTSGTTKDLLSIACPDANTCWVVAQAGTIRKTSDGGATWSSQTSGTTYDLSDISCVDANTCWIIGGFSTTLKTTDGGATWSAQTIGASGATSIVCFDVNTCLVVGTSNGSSAMTRKTTDGGATWSALTNNSSKNLNELGCANASTCLAVGVSGMIRKTSDGGTTWATQTSGTTNTLSGVFCADANTCWAVGASGKLIKTTNGGTTWSAQTSGTTSRTLDAVRCIGANTCWVAGAKLIKTTDGGTTWVNPQTRTVTVEDLYAVGSGDANTWWTAGLNGAMLKTTDGGTTWSTQTSGTTSSPNGLACVNTSTCYAVGNSGIILKTTDGGATKWITQTSGTTNALYGISCVDANTCWAAGNTGTILKTVNGGATWSAQTSGTTYALFSISCADANTCLAVGSSGTIRKTTDGGATWQQSLSGASVNLNGIACTSASFCIAVGASGTIRKTTDGGMSWTAPTSGTTGQLQKIACTNASTCWAVGFNGTILKTSDGGTTWRSETSGVVVLLYDVRFPSANSGIAVGGSGSAVRYVPSQTPSNSVFLQPNTGNTQAGAPAGVNLCTNVELGVDAQGNADRKIYCSHAALNEGTWYTLTFTTGITDANGNALTANVTRTFKTIGTPALAQASITENAVAASSTSALTIDFDNPLSAGSVTTSSIILQEMGQRFSGTASGSNLCGSVSLGMDGSGFTDRRASCIHSGLQRGKWYEMRVLSGEGGLQSSGGQALTSSITRRFKTAYGTGDRETVRHSEIANMITEGWFTRTGEATATTKLVAAPEIATTVPLPAGTATVTIPQNAEITKQGGGTFDSSALTVSDATTAVRNLRAALTAAISYGVPGVPLVTTAPVSMSIPVDASLNGATLEVYRSPDADFANDTTPATACVVANAACTFTTTGLSYFALTLKAAADCDAAGECGKP